MKRLILLAVTLFAAAMVIVAAPTAAQATPGKVTICPAGDSGKIDTTGDPLSVTVTAPDGFLISGYCVKAGTTTDFVIVDPPQESVTITGPGGKAVSHYSVTYVEDVPQS